LAALPEGTASLAVVGDPTFQPGYASAAVRYAVRLGLTSRVEWLGPLIDEALAHRMSSSHVLVVPSEYEGFGIAYLEGMAFGLPAIATTAGGAAEVVRDGENGFLVPPGDARALARSLRRLYEDRSYLEKLSLGALRSYASHPTWEQTADSIRLFLADRMATSHSAARFKLKEEAA
jgi:glycosyltransferase involved in cell wall biosynthesis